MKTKEQLLDEVNGFQHISEETKELFRKVINTVEAELPAEQRRDYELALIQYQDTIEEYRTAIDRGIDQGRKEGREEGIKEGITKGREEGLKEGRQEGREEMQIEAAKAMKAKGIDADTICECTGLSIEEIRKL